MEGRWKYSSYLFATHTRRRWVVSTMPQPLYPQERLSTHCIGGWVELGASLDGTENLSTGIQSPDSLVCSISLYQLHCTSHHRVVWNYDDVLVYNIHPTHIFIIITDDIGRFSYFWL